MIEVGFLFSPSVKKFVGGKFDGTIMHMHQDSGEWAVNLNMWTDLGKKVQTRLRNKTLHAEKNLTEHLRQGKALFKLAAQVIDHDLSKWTMKQFTGWFKQACAHYVELNALGFLAVVSDIDHNLLSNTLAGVLEKHATAQNPTQKYLSVLITPGQPDLNWSEQLELLEICKKYKTLERTTKSKEFKVHVKKYRWLNYGYRGPLWTGEDFIRRVRKIMEHDLEREYTEHKNQFILLRKRQSEIIRELKLSPDEIYMFEQARILMFTKAYRINVRHAIQYAFDLVFSDLGKRFTLPITFFHYAGPKEILQLLMGKKIDTVEILRRKNRVLKIVEKGKTRFIPVKQMDLVLKQALEKEIRVKQDFVEGKVAFAGRARGKAKLVFGIEDLKKVIHGDVLVAVATTPELLPAMGRAIAFVTDSGGITSHAAIVAREMKKPCVIGTKFATKIFKDGDVIEIDANKGIVRKI